MSALFLDVANVTLVNSVSKQVDGITTCMGNTTEPALLAKKIFDEIITSTIDFGGDEHRLLIGLCYCIHSVRCDNPDEARGWDTTDMEIARRIPPIIRGSGLLRKSIH